MATLFQFEQSLLENSVLSFIHIPKTAGTSFTKVLANFVNQYGKFKVISPNVLDGYETPDYDINDFMGISGHFSYEIRKVLSRTPLFLTFIRDPIARSLSHFKQFQQIDIRNAYFRNSKNFHHYQKISRLTLDGLAFHPFFGKEVSNLQTRMLGLLIDHPIDQLTDIKPFDRRKDRLISLELAKERLEQFAFIGIQEYFQESMDVFACQFGTAPVEKLPLLNISENKSPLEYLSPRALEIIHELNQLDIQLYEFAKKLFAKRYDAAKTSLQNKHLGDETTAFHELLSRQYVHKNRIDRFPFRYEFQKISEAVKLTGWFSIEEIEGKHWAWSGPGTTAHVDITLERKNDLHFCFQVFYYIAQDILDSLRITVDDQKIKIAPSLEEGRIVFSGTIPADPGKEQHKMTRISFHVDRTAYPPGMTAETPGARLIGIALSWIEFTPVKE